MPSPAERPTFLDRIEILIASSYKKHLAEVRRASSAFSQLGLSVYPPPDSTEVIVDEFVFLGGQMVHSKQQIERHFLEGIRGAKLVYVVATNGYLGQSASSEMVYAMALGKTVVLSQPITTFGKDVPSKLATIIQQYAQDLPELAIEEIGKFQEDGFLKKAELQPPHFETSEKRVVFFSIVDLMRSLRSRSGIRTPPE